MTREMESEAITICNLSDLIEEEALQKGIEKGIQQGEQQASKKYNFIISQKYEQLSQKDNEIAMLKKLLAEYQKQNSFKKECTAFVHSHSFKKNVAQSNFIHSLYRKYFIIYIYIKPPSATTHIIKLYLLFICLTVHLSTSYTLALLYLFLRFISCFKYSIVTLPESFDSPSVLCWNL